MSNLDKRRTILENIKRNALAGGGARFGGHHATTTCASRPGSPTFRRETNAVVIAMSDVSGSMGEFEKYITRSFYFWMVRFLRTKYDNVEIVFITHHTEAKEVDERGLLHARRERRDQASRRAYKLALDIDRGALHRPTAGTSTPSTSPTATTGATPTTSAA